MPFREITTVYSKNHAKPTNIPCRQNTELLPLNFKGFSKHTAVTKSASALIYTGTRPTFDEHGGWFGMNWFESSSVH